MEMYGYQIIRESDLSHHGILGQKWGKRNGPPYPLGPSDHSKAEQKAGWKKSLNSSQSIDSKMKGNYNSDDKKGRRKWSELSEEEKRRRLKIGVAVAGSVLAVGATVYLAKTGAFSGIIKQGELEAGKTVESFSGMAFDKFDPKIFASEGLVSSIADIPNLPKIKDFPKELTENFIINDLENVNLYGGKSNCVACAITEYFRNRGFDVTANIRNDSVLGNTFSINEVDLLFPGFADRFNKIPITKNVSQSADHIRTSLLKYGEGASGIFAVNYREDYKEFRKLINPEFEDTGHAISWRVINNKVLFTDGQNNYYGDGYFEGLLTTADPMKVYAGRYDDLEIDQTFIPVFMRPTK